MLPELRYIKNIDSDNYRYRVGAFINDKLEGFGFEVICENGQKSYVIGYYHNDVLHGLGFKEDVHGKYQDVGIYQEGKLLTPDEFKQIAKQQKVGSDYNYGTSFINCVKYYLGDNPENGLMLYTSNENVVHYGLEKRIFNDRWFIDYQQRDIYGNRIYFNIYSENGVIREYKYGHTFLGGASSCFEYILDNMKNLNLKMFEKKEIRVKEGATSLNQGAYKVSSGVTLYLPSSIKKLGKSALSPSSSKAKYLLDVFYDGTMEQWNNIEKGFKEDYSKSNPYYQDYYHHESDEYVRATRVVDWAVGAIGIMIHCKDGDIYDYDHSRDD